MGAQCATGAHNTQDIMMEIQGNYYSASPSVGAAQDPLSLALQMQLVCEEFLMLGK